MSTKLQFHLSLKSDFNNYISYSHLFSVIFVEHRFMNMQFCDLNRQYETYKAEIDQAIHSVIDSSAFINGREIELLESELSGYTGVKHSICCSSGTDALLLALMALDIQPGDEVICPAFSFFASASMISLLKATPVFVDVSPIDFNIDVKKIEEKISSNTKGIIAVSLFGQCADIESINEIATLYDLWVIEDAAQSFGAIYKGKKSCSLTEIAVTSFFPSKPLGCYGDGGAIFTSNDSLASKLMLLRSHGQSARYYHELIGINGRMDTIQAAVLRVKLKHLDVEIVTRQLAAGLYSELLKDKVMLPEIVENRSSVWAQYTIGVEERDSLKQKLLEFGIPTAIHYPLILPRQLAFADLPSFGEEFQVAQLLSETVLSLPMHGMITVDEVKFIAQTIIDILND
jgi:UDP-2-acetamido-2-deoxy-ribo-hexuluronate aminotransferase